MNIYISLIITMVFSAFFSGVEIAFVSVDKLRFEMERKGGITSRILVTSVLIPWNSCGMTQATILNVPTLTYLPYCFFNILSPIMSIIVAAIGYKIIKHPTPEKQ